MKSSLEMTGLAGRAEQPWLLRTVRGHALLLGGLFVLVSNAAGLIAYLLVRHRNG